MKLIKQKVVCNVDSNGVVSDEKITIFLEKGDKEPKDLDVYTAIKYAILRSPYKDSTKILRAPQLITDIELDEKEGVIRVPDTIYNEVKGLVLNYPVFIQLGTAAIDLFQTVSEPLKEEESEEATD